MSVRIDHLILPVNQLEPSFDFYCGLLGFQRDGKHGPFDIVRVSPEFILLFTEFQTPGGFHLAFSLAAEKFDALVSKIKRDKIPYGDRFDRADNFAGPTPQPGARGDRPGIYLTDPSRHLIEVRCE